MSDRETRLAERVRELESAQHSGSFVVTLALPALGDDRVECHYWTGDGGEHAAELVAVKDNGKAFAYCRAHATTLRLTYGPKDTFLAVRQR